MKISSHALYIDLLHDLSDTLPRGCFDNLEDSGAYQCMTVPQFRSLALAQSFLKKFQDSTGPQADETALQKFLQSNIECKNWSLRLENSGDELLLGLFKEQLFKFFYPSGNPLIDSFHSILTNGRTGPGASLLANGNDFYTKLFSSRLSCTSENLYDVYQGHVSYDPTWKSAEKQRAYEYGDVDLVAGNRLSFVPKNDKVSRVICTEPSLNMFFQLGLGALIDRRLQSYFGIDLSYQQNHNRELARLGSLKEAYVTIDLSSASDTVGHKMLKEVMPRNALAWFDLLRSPVTTLPNGEEQELHMISSMGNGFTFSLETLIFSCIVSSVYHSLNIRMVRPVQESPFKRGNPGNFGVFGDDIIVVPEARHRVLRLLNILGFTVNQEKSFFEGPFRESCGGDFFRGHNVRGVYVKSLKTQANRFVTINRLNEWSARSGIPLPRTIKRLLRSVRYLPVPLYENDDAGIKVPFDFVRNIVKDKDTQTIVYRRWQSKPSYIRLRNGVLHSPRKVKARIHNAPGLYLAFLRGDLASGKDGFKFTYPQIGIRLGVPVTYHTKRAVTSNWNWLPTTSERSEVSWRQLVTADRKSVV